MPVVVVVLIDALVAGLILLVFAFFHHVMPWLITEKKLQDAQNNPTQPQMSVVETVPETAAPTDPPIETEAFTEPTVPLTTEPDTRTPWQIKFEEHFSDEVIITENSYKSPEVSVTIDTHKIEIEGEQIVYYVADIYVASIDNFVAAVANNDMSYYSTQKSTELDKNAKAIISICGDFVTYQKTGFMMRNPFVLSVLALLLTQGLMQANMTNVIVFVNYTQPGNTLISGYAISIMYLGMSLGSVLVGPQADKKEPRKVLSVSLLLTGIGCALMLLFSENTPFVLMAGALGILGFGLGGNGAIFMKVVLSGLSPQMAGAGTGTYGLFRDISAPFGVAVFVPMFTNGVTNRMAHDASLLAGSAAVGSIHTLAIVEIVCVAAAIVLVNLLPKREN